MTSFDFNIIRRDSLALDRYTIATAKEYGDELPASCKELLAYLDGKTGGRRLPGRTDIEPADLKPHLPYLCIAEIEYDEAGRPVDFVFRLVGTRVAATYGEVTGKRASEYDNPDVQERFFLFVRRAMESREAVVGEAKRSAAGSKIAGSSPAPNALALIVPLSSDGDHIDQILVYSTID